MKQTKWQRLATIGLCSSLVINAFSGVTAVAETITIESSPTVASSAKEATSASSATPASTESSQETTETSREEVTQETEKQAEIPEVKTETTESVPENSSENDRQKSISPRWVPNDQVIYPRMIFGFTDETGKAFADENLTLSGTYYKLARHTATSQWRPYADRYPIVSSNAGGGQYRVAVNATIPMPYDFLTNLPAGYTHNLYAIEQLKIDNTLKYVDSIVAPPGSINRTRYSEQQTSEAAQFGNYVTGSLTQRDRTFSKNSANIFSLNSLALAPEITDVLTMLRTDSIERGPILIGFDGTTTYRETLNYVVTRKQVTEKFVDTNGVAITPPTGFTQNKKTPMTSNDFTFKQSSTLPDTYQAGGKTYKFKGWYKGKTKPNTLTTTKAPSYAVTYDGNDDLTVVYEEEAVTTLYPSLDVNFVDEKGVGFTPALTFSGKYRVQRTSDRLYTDLYDLTSKSKGSGQYTLSLNNGTMPLSPELLRVYGNDKPINGTNRLNFSLDKLAINQQLKYVNSIELDTVKSVMKMYGYNYTSGSATIIDPNQVPTEYNLSAGNIALLGFDTDGVYFSKESSGVFNTLMGYASDGGKPLITMNLFSGNPVNASKLVYTVTRKQVNENFVDTNGTKITPPTGFTQGNQIPMTSNTFKYTAARALPASYSVGGKTYIFQGWYKGKTKPNTLTTSTTPTYNTTFDGNDDMTAVYKEANISANLTMRGAVDVIDNGATMEYWEVLLKNTGEAPLTSVKIKPTTDWAAGISTPTELFILGTGQNTKVRPITKEQWEAGFEIPLDSSLPVGGQLTINLLGTKVTGQPNQVLKAAVEVTGNFNKLTASDTVRIKDLDQETKEPTGEGFISVPTFNFGQVGVAGSTQQHSLKKAADYYGNGTRNPYLRIKKTQPNWSLTAQLSQPKSATDSLPTTTRLLLGTAAAASFTDYNQPTETKTPLGKTGTVNLTADNTATAVVANQQFTGSDVYQLDFTFANIKLEVPANQGMVGQQYQAAVTWNLVTGP
ncbi:TPA: WxL domain-containing protein [Enterococcus faecalis]|uniref:WxL domain-containing protein n=2 Tax=Enterococcus faecalis TaxID=1351 RepID=UPI000C780C9A|nr:WxL domain-containing protein [Enterococcus faecalis]EGO2583413.1 WxL domain-containing protein [Enterococcus faecalis]EGO2590031.1 WxL domain-containing protein [Enterococcus faecalis]EGO2815166.1 WxL domain-containing protein [Enterococcus faecalis]EGO7562943.1 WxL domain-containing protein [Enterococcus faecalis]EGO7610069.1 WxL domain-containing protein [Enterococcus faecalis]